MTCDCTTFPLPLHAQPARMRRVDLSSDERISVVMEVVGQLSRATEPNEVQQVFAQGVRRLNPIDGYISLSVRGLAPGEYKITRMSLGRDAAFGRWGDPWRDFHRLPTHRGGLLGELIRSAYPELIHHLDLRNDPVLGDKLRGYGSLMAVPLFDDGQPLNWGITLRHDPEGFTVKDLEEQILRGNLVGGTVRQVLLSKRLREANAQIRDEMNRIAAIQRALLPATMPEIAGAALAASYETFDTAGGDLYSFRPVDAPSERADANPDSPWTLLIADASGHGPAAAVVSAMLHAIVHAYPRRLESPAELLSHANRHLAAKRIDNSFVTAFAAIYDPRSRLLRFSRAGHEPPILKNAGSGGATLRLEAAGGLPLGILDGVEYESAETELEPGQTLVMYTDGITEARNGEGEMFGIRGIEEALLQCSGEPECVIQSINTALREHEDGRRPADDQTIVAMKVS